MKLWIDDIRKAPNGFAWLKSVNQAIAYVENHNEPIEFLDIDHDAGDYQNDGGDYVRFLDWLEEKNIKAQAIHIHSMNPVGVDNMRRIIRRNAWKEI